MAKRIEKTEEAEKSSEHPCCGDDKLADLRERLDAIGRQILLIGDDIIKLKRTTGVR